MNILERLTQPHPSIQDEAERRLIRFFLAITLISSIICLLSYFPLSDVSTPQIGALETFALVIVSFICYCLGRTKYVYFGLYLSLTFIYLIVVGIILAASDERILLALVFPVLTASIYLSMRWMIIWGVICFVTAVTISAVALGDWDLRENSLILMLILAIIFINGMGVFLRHQNALEAHKELGVRLIAEAALRESRHFVEQITSTAPDYIYVYDFAQRKRLYENRSWAAVLGYDITSERIDEDALILNSVHPDDRAALQQMRERRRVAAEDEVIKIEYRLRYADGTWHWVYSRSMVFKRDAQGVPTQALGVVQDITDRRVAQEALRESQHLIEQIAAAAPDYIYVYDIPKKQTAYQNRPWETLLGYSRNLSPDEEKQLQFTLIHPEDEARFLAYRQQERVAIDGEVLQLEYRIRYIDNTWHWLYSRKTIFKRDAEGSPIQILGIVQDVTDRRMVEEQLRESRHFIEQITRMSPDLVYVIDLSEKKIVYGNRSWDELVARLPYPSRPSEEDLILSLVHPEDKTAFLAIRKQQAEAQDGEVLGVEYRIAIAEGAWLWLYSRHMVFKRDAQGNPSQILGITQNITLRKSMEEAENERRLLADILRETSAIVNSSLDTEEVLELIADNIYRVVEADRVTVMLIDGDQIQLSVTEGARQDANGGERTGRAACSVIELAVMRKILETKTALRIPDVRQTPDYVLLPGADSIVSYLGIPLWARGQIIGVIHLENHIADFYTERHVEQLGAFAEQVSSALQNALLHEQSQLLSATNERQRIARDLHDSVTQTLFAASMVAQTLPILWDTNREGVRSQLDNLSLLTRGALADMRTLLVELRPAALENADIGELMRYLLDALATRHQVTVALVLEGNERLAGEIQIAFYRIAQEGLNNIAKHARAKQVTVRLVRQTDQVNLTITDDGRGFDPSAVGNDHFGLSIMRERAESVGATLTVDTAPGKGCCVQIAWQNSPTFALIQEGIR